jgi:hypothetical protein
MSSTKVSSKRGQPLLFLKCQSTSLHGWQYIYKSKSQWRVFWLFMVLTSLIVAIVFVFKQGRKGLAKWKDFAKLGTHCQMKKHFYKMGISCRIGALCKMGTLCKIGNICPNRKTFQNRITWISKYLANANLRKPQLSYARAE